MQFCTAVTACETMAARSVALAAAVNGIVVVKLIPTRSGATGIPVNGLVWSMAVCTLCSGAADPSEAIP